MSKVISIVTISYNCEKSIQRTINSVINQTYKGFEYIIIDGASTDQTVEVIKSNEEFIDFWVSEPDKGIYDAMAKGLHYATGEWIIFMNAGDCFASLDVLMSIFGDTKKDYSCYSVIYGDMMADRGLSTEIIKARPFFLNKSMLPAMGFSHQSVFIRTELAKKIGFDPTYIVAADYAMIYRIYELFPCFYYYPIAVGHIEAAGFSHQNRRLWLNETAQITKRGTAFKRQVAIERRLIYYRLQKLKRMLLG